jgi:hypothetical protein
MTNFYSVITTYLRQINSQNDVLKSVKTKLDNMSDEDANTVIDELGSDLNSKVIMDNISAVACSSATNLMDSSDVESYFRDVFESDTSNYSHLVFEQIFALLKRINYIAELKS